MPAEAKYETIGAGYALQRRADPRVEAAIHACLGSGARVLNVGAGAGSYEPRDRAVVAVEPAITMIRQRPPGSAPVVRATGQRLPFADDAFDVALASLTLQHWRDRAAGLRELRRVASDRVVVFTWDPDAEPYWLVTDYLPELLCYDRARFPSLHELRDSLGPIDIIPVPIPHDCTDGFMGAHWRRPHAYLDARVRASISTFVEGTAPGPCARLAAELANGDWERKYGDLLGRESLDCGYRVVVARGRTA
jgi:SAM-dependent methyltransferase